MTMAQKIKMALANAGLSEAELARRLDMSPQALHQRIKTGKFTVAELESIAQAVGARYTFGFTFEDGTTV